MFKNQFDQHLDKSNMIDMLLFIEAIYDWDSIAQDIELVTYDLEKWYMLPWDKDTSFGMYWDESGLVGNSETQLLINYNQESPTQKPWYKTYHAFTGEVEARYAQLRDEGIFSVNGLQSLIKELTAKIPAQAWEAERQRWEEDGRPSLEETSPGQIISWFGKRLAVLDRHFNYQPREE